MAAPNIVNVTTITGKTAVVASNTTIANVVVNATGSNTVVKVNSVIVTNYSASSLLANVEVYRSSSSYYLVGGVTVPAQSTLIVSSKDTSFYLEEGDAIRTATSANAHVVASYEIIA